MEIDVQESIPVEAERTQGDVPPIVILKGTPKDRLIAVPEADTNSPTHPNL